MSRNESEKLMSGSEPEKRNPKTKTRKAAKKAPGSFVPRPPLNRDALISLRDFVSWGLGDGHNSWWEENFLNSIKHLTYNPPVWLSDKQQVKLQEIKDKLHFDRQDVPLPPIDPDGVEENDDPDRWPTVRGSADQFEDDEFINFREA
jgi:hypothetical protein